MILRTKNILLLLGIVLASGSISQACNKLVWADEFDYEGKPDETKWGYDIGGSGWGNGEAQYYTDRLDNASVQDGYLTIRAIREQYQSKNYTSARLVTKNKGDWKYGRIEVKAKIPYGRGTWPAIWMLPTEWKHGNWPASGEIDIMEHVGYDENKVHGTVHTDAYNHLKGTQKGGSVFVSTATSSFHIYACEWYADRIDFYVDDKKYYTFFKEADNFREWPFDEYFHLILNIAVGGSWGGAQGIDNSIFPQEMKVDYVRVYERVNEIVIEGENRIAENQTNLEFSCGEYSNGSYQWIVPNDAVIVSGRSSSSILVNWGDTEGDVLVKVNSPNACSNKVGRMSVSFGPPASLNEDSGKHDENDLFLNQGNLVLQLNFGPEHLFIYQTNGTLIFSKNLERNEADEVDLPSLQATGVYFIRVLGANQSYSKKVILR